MDRFYEKLDLCRVPKSMDLKGTLPSETTSKKLIKKIIIPPELKAVESWMRVIETHAIDSQERNMAFKGNNLNV